MTQPTLNTHEKMIERKQEYQDAMRKIVARFSDRLKNDVHWQSLEAMREDLWRSGVEIERVLEGKK
jgi:hypothetical protein